jgi:hypothetical protein
VILVNQSEERGNLLSFIDIFRVDKTGLREENKKWQ